MSRWLLKLLILPVVWVCASEKRTWKNSILYFTKEFHNFTKEFYSLYIQKFPKFPRHYKKSILSWTKLAKKTRQKSGDVLFFFLFFPSAATFSGRQQYQSLKRMIICWRKKFKVLYVLHKKDTQGLGGKKWSWQTTELWKVTGCAKKCPRCVFVLFVLSVSHLFSFLDTEEPKYLCTPTLKLNRASEMSQTLRLLLLCISC